MPGALGWSYRPSLSVMQLRRRSSGTSLSVENVYETPASTTCRRSRPSTRNAFTRSSCDWTKWAQPSWWTGTMVAAGKTCGQFDGVVRVHCELEHASARGGSTAMENDHSRLERLRDAADALEPDRVAGYVDQRLAGLDDLDHESDHLAGEPFGAVRTVACRGGGDPQRRSPGAGDLAAATGRESDRASDLLRARRRREDHGNPLQELATGVIQIVGMLLVADQRNIEVARHRRARPPDPWSC